MGELISIFGIAVGVVMLIVAEKNKKIAGVLIIFVCIVLGAASLLTKNENPSTIATASLTTNKDLVSTTLKMSKPTLEPTPTQNIDMLINEQLVLISNTLMRKDFYLFSTMDGVFSGASVVLTLQNKASVSVKDCEISILHYDKDGFPCKLGMYGGKGDHLKQITINDVNIKANSSIKYGNTENDRKLLLHNMATIKNEDLLLCQAIACIRSVTFYDGTIWDNPYYPYWLNTYEDRPL